MFFIEKKRIYAGLPTKKLYKIFLKNHVKMLGKGMTLIVFLLNEPFSVKFNVGVIVARC